MITGSPAPLVVEGDSLIPVEASRLQIGQTDILKLTLSASGQSTCLLTAPFSLLLTAQHMESMVVIHARMTISSSLMVWRVIVGHWGDSVNWRYLLLLPHQLELLKLFLREECIKIVQPVAKEFVFYTMSWISSNKNSTFDTIVYASFCIAIDVIHKCYKHS